MHYTQAGSMATYIRQDLTRFCLILTHDEKLTDSLWAEYARKAQQTLQELKDGPNKMGHPHGKVAPVVWTYRFLLSNIKEEFERGGIKPGGICTNGWYEIGPA